MLMRLFSWYIDQMAAIGIDPLAAIVLWAVVGAGLYFGVVIPWLARHS